MNLILLIFFTACVLFFLVSITSIIFGIFQRSAYLSKENIELRSMIFDLVTVPFGRQYKAKEKEARELLERCKKNELKWLLE